MAQALWQGNWIHRSRLASGLVLFTFALFHFLNIAAGLVSPELLESVQHARKAVTSNPPGQIVLYGAFVVHGGLALWQVAMRRTLRMAFSQWLQMVLGILIPVQLIQHVVNTNYADRVFDVEDEMSSVILMLWSSPEALQQYLLLLVVWVHGCIGLHMWLRLARWWRPLVPYMIGLAVLIPSLALAGFVTEGRRMWSLFAEDGLAAQIMEDYNWPDATEMAHLAALSRTSLWVFAGLLAFALSLYYLRRLIQRSRSVRVTYVDGPQITADRGLTLLEMSQMKAIPHPSLCGGKGRCTTCRVAVLAGLEDLPAPSSAEARSLMAVNAADNVRLACQIRPTAALTVKRVYSPKGRRRVHSAQGEEKTIAILFLDIRGFTARSAGLLPYDVVFLLNRFFDAIVPEVTRAGGTVDKYMGDGMLALFETHDPASSARSALAAAANIGVALARFNRVLASEGEEPVRIGMGLHAGTVVLGEIGTVDNAPRTLIGSAVNAASRLEAMTKELGVELLVSREVFDTAGLPDLAVRFETFELRGVDEPVDALPLPRASSLDAVAGPLTDPPD
ncbi:adenylate/guanylate cyclase domain-containing protein [Phaeobacter sp. B1627]|uniref:adenylate/guanylate cyclase domain-containing protein n=1 Tax=Phaeobacter sp. B1627 TaxID=2583809 RepID=UPI001119CBC4|nr:adenylate/guanylate cyclase domain-containing protein [Phaeobacter sp. B1627]TNJ48498.1 adenylate/guanylate cyclase domain-containing protein [Phaeobacter sp. B1627]